MKTDTRFGARNVGNYRILNSQATLVIMVSYLANPCMGTPVSRAITWDSPSWWCHLPARPTQQPL